MVKALFGLVSVAGKEHKKNGEFKISKLAGSPEVEGRISVHQLSIEQRLERLIDEGLAEKALLLEFKANKKRFEILYGEIKNGNYTNFTKYTSALSNKYALEKGITISYLDYEIRMDNLKINIDSLFERAGKIGEGKCTEILSDLEFLRMSLGLEGAIKELEEKTDDIKNKICRIETEALIERKPDRLQDDLGEQRIVLSPPGGLSFLGSMSLFPMIRNSKEILFEILLKNPELLKNIDNVVDEFLENFLKIKPIRMLVSNLKGEYEQEHFAAENYQDILIVRQIFETFVVKNKGHPFAGKCMECLELGPFKEAQEKLRQELELLQSSNKQLQDSSIGRSFYQRQIERIGREISSLETTDKNYIRSILLIQFEFRVLSEEKQAILEKFSMLHDLEIRLEKFSAEEQISPQTYSDLKGRLKAGIAGLQEIDSSFIAEADKLGQEFKTAYSDIEKRWQKLSNFKARIWEFRNNGIISEDTYVQLNQIVKNAKYFIKNEGRILGKNGSHAETAEQTLANLDSYLKALEQKERDFLELKKDLDYVFLRIEEPGFKESISRIRAAAGKYEKDAISKMVEAIESRLKQKPGIPAPALQELSAILNEFIKVRKRNALFDQTYRSAVTVLAKIQRPQKTGIFDIFKREEE